jgi:hypothetical protein
VRAVVSMRVWTSQSREQEGGESQSGTLWNWLCMCCVWSSMVDGKGRSLRRLI